MTDATIPLSDLREMWRQAQMHWYYAVSQSGYFRDNVRKEIARRTIAELRQRITELESELAEAKAARVATILRSE